MFQSFQLLKSLAARKGFHICIRRLVIVFNHWNIWNGWNGWNGFFIELEFSK
jgi:hypothetical protein